MGVINLGILVEKIKRKLIVSGFVTNTDYATADTGGVIKYNNTVGTTVNSSGVLTGITRTDSQYSSGGNGMIICKGTIENIKKSLTESALAQTAAAAVPSPEDNATYNLQLKYTTADGWVVILTAVS